MSDRTPRHAATPGGGGWRWPLNATLTAALAALTVFVVVAVLAVTAGDDPRPAPTPSPAAGITFTTAPATAGTALPTLAPVATRGLRMGDPVVWSRDRRIYYWCGEKNGRALIAATPDMPPMAVDPKELKRPGQPS